MLNQDRGEPWFPLAAAAAPPGERAREKTPLHFGVVEGGCSAGACLVTAGDLISRLNRAWIPPWSRMDAEAIKG
jgi:hypothetical protein